MESHSDPVAVRLARLEAEVARLTEEVARLQANSPLEVETPPRTVPPPVPPRRAKPAARTAPAARSIATQLAAFGSADLLARIGIALLLLGLAFLLKYSIDQGWISAGVRVAMGAALGLGLVGGGWLLRTRRAELARVLQGGGIAALYASLFAGFQLYGLMGYTPAFTLMVAVTALAFGLAVVERSAVLSVVAVLGGLGTPFLLNRDAGTLVGLMGYTAVVLAGGSAVFYRFGWRALLVALSLGGATVLLGAAVFAFPADAPWPEQFAFQMGTVLVWAVATLLPLTPAAQAARFRGDALLAVLAALLLWAGSGYAWRVEADTMGVLGLTLGLGYAALAWTRRMATEDIGGWLLAAALLWAGGWIVRFDDAWSLVGPALASAGLLVAIRHGNDAVRVIGLLLMALTGLVAAAYMAERNAGPRPLLDADVLALLLTLGLLAFGFYRGAWNRGTWLILHLLLLQWLGFTLNGLPSGGAWTSTAWGVVGIVYVVLGVRDEQAPVRLMGLGTILLAIAKLLLFDLPQLSTLARTLLFLAAGALLLAVSYFVPSLLRPTPTSAGSTPESEASPSPPR